jgi:DNA-binding XRE family transcriptional regulator
MNIINKLTQERKMKYVSQTVMAQHLGVTLATLYRYETGKRQMSLELACKYADKVGFELKLLAKY